MLVTGVPVEVMTEN